MGMVVFDARFRWVTLNGLIDWIYIYYSTLAMGMVVFVARFRWVTLNGFIDEIHIYYSTLAMGMVVFDARFRWVPLNGLIDWIYVCYFILSHRLDLNVLLNVSNGHGSLRCKIQISYFKRSNRLVLTGGLTNS